MWPTPQDYNEAIQEPGICFADDDLRRSRVELNHLGLPRSMTGAFASVYRMSNVSGAYAVRCFLEPGDDLEFRYQCIRQAVRKAGSDCFVDFDFLPQGIKVLGQWYPILKMRWVEGDSLDRYLDRYVRNPDRVRMLDEMFMRMIESLNKHGIAHGDLQAGNLLVSDDGLKLIDYDGMYVPGLEGRTCPELGHRNFQHPERDHQFYDAALDHFSAWVIHASLKALLVDPALWRRLECGDDCLLFRYADFRSPSHSEAFRELTNHASEELKELGSFLIKLTGLRPESVPPLGAGAEEIDKLLTDELHRFKPGSRKSRKTEEQSEQAAGAQWYMDQIEALEDDPALRATETGARGFVDSFGKSVSIVGRKAWRRMIWYVAPMIWAQDQLDEGTYAFNMGEYREAIAIFNEMAQYFRAVPPLSRPPLVRWDALVVTTFIRLGYCYAEIDQMGTAAHYFREAQKLASNPSLGELELSASLLLAASYFELKQKDRALSELEKTTHNALVLVGAVRLEKSWTFGKRLTIPNMMVDLGHRYLRSSSLSDAYCCYESAMEACLWLSNEMLNPEVRLIVGRASVGFGTAKLSEGDDEESGISMFMKNVPELEQLRELVRIETKGPLATDPRYAEFMRTVAHRYDRRNDSIRSTLAYATALRAYRLAESDGRFHLQKADCYLGLGKPADAVTTLLSTYPWGHGMAATLMQKLERIEEFSQAFVVATVVFDDQSHRYRYQCLDRLCRLCPAPAELADILKELESSPLANKIAAAELLLNLAGDLKEANRASEASLMYASAFRTFQRAGVEESYGSSVMECLLGSGDLDSAADMLIDSGNLEDNIRLLVNVMVGKGAYKADTTSKIVARVIEHQLSLPVAAVGEEELSKSLELLEWCAGEESELARSMRQRVNKWFSHRELNIAHSLVNQGKFAPALTIFEKYEGEKGPNVVSVYELWVMKYLTVSLFDEHASYSAKDGLAFGCAVELIKLLKHRDCLKPHFCMQVAELVNKAAPLGMGQHVGQLEHALSAMGEEYKEAASRLAHFVESQKTTGAKKSSTIMPRLVVTDEDGKVTQKTYDDQSSGMEITVYGAGDSPVVESESSKEWTDFHRALFLIDKEGYPEAIVALKKFQGRDGAGELLCESFIALGYCYHLLSDQEEAKNHFKQAVHAGRELDIFKFFKAAVCLTYFLKTPVDYKPELRKLADPSVPWRDVLRLAAQLKGIPIDSKDNLALSMADLLYSEASEQEQSHNLTYARSRYRSALTIYGTESTERRSEIVDCLDAIEQYNRSGAKLMEAFERDYVIGSARHDLLMKIARRHAKNPNRDSILTVYETNGITLARFVDEAERELLIHSLSRLLNSQVPPRRLLYQIVRDLNELKGVGKLSREFCVSTARFIQSNLVFCSQTRKQEIESGLLRIGKILEAIAPEAEELVREAVKQQSPLSAEEAIEDRDEPDISEQSLF